MNIDVKWKVGAGNQSGYILQQNLAREEMKAKKPKDPIYTLRLSEIQRMKKDAAMEASKTAWRMLLGLPALALHDKFGFGKERMARFMEATLDVYESYQKGYISIEDVDTVIKDECGLRIEDIDTENHRLF